ncbi:MAG: helix-turn-helix transcriptional regulator, partial [Bacilli bacterium]
MLARRFIMNPKATGEFICQLRKERKLTQNELAELIQVTDKAISRWEVGDGFPDVSILPKLS